LTTVVELIGTRVLERVLVLSTAHPVVDREVLHRLHVELDARHLRQLGIEAPDHVGGRDAALGERLEVDLDAAAVERGVGAVGADERGNALDRRIGSAILCPRTVAGESSGKEVEPGAWEMP
jgi:hypothetical protein